MTKMDKFFDLPDVDTITADVEISERLGTVKIKAMSDPQFNKYQKLSQNPKDLSAPLDNRKLNRFIVKNHVVEPNFCSVEFLERAGFPGDTDGYLDKKILPGEISEMVRQITSLSAFEISGVTQEMVEEAKN